MLGAGAAFSTVLTAYRYTSGIRGYMASETDEDEVERRETARKLRRRPLSETIEQLGEGRGKLYRGRGHVDGLIDFSRYLRTRIRGEEATKVVGEIRHRCEGCTGGQLDSILPRRSILSRDLAHVPPFSACTYLCVCMKRIDQDQSRIVPVAAGFICVRTMCDLYTRSWCSMCSIGYIILR